MTALLRATHAALPLPQRGLYLPSMNWKIATRASAWIRNERRLMSSHSSVAKKLSAMALSKQSPAEPVSRAN